jgi:hypothetical protein
MPRHRRIENSLLESDHPLQHGRLLADGEPGGFGARGSASVDPRLPLAVIAEAPRLQDRRAAEIAQRRLRDRRAYRPWREGRGPAAQLSSRNSSR